MPHRPLIDAQHSRPLEVVLGVPGTGAARHPLAVIEYRAGSARNAVDPHDALLVTAPFPPVGETPPVETWTTPAPARRAREGSFELAMTGDVLFGSTMADVSEPGALEREGVSIYREMLGTIERLGYPHLQRAWNCVPRINEDEQTADGPLERYKLFCRGRSLAFQQHYGTCFAERLPAATAIGGTGRSLVVYFLAAREPGHHVENPRQVAAWAYPAQYGPRAPSFARATRAPSALGGVLFISGTASVVGHESRHHGDVIAQLGETMRNIDALVGSGRLSMLKVYLREPADHAAVRERLDVIAPGVPTIYVQGDVCRRELLIEIEGVSITA